MLSQLRKRFFHAISVGLLIMGVLAFCGLSLINTIRPAGIIIHHSAIPPRPDGRPIDASVIDEIHKKRGYTAFYWGRFYHIGYHYIILPDGTVQHGRPEHCRGAHAQGYNSYIGICLVGDFSSKDNPNGERGPTEPSEAQMQSLAGLSRNLREKYQIPLTSVLRHNDVNPNTECPGDRFPIETLLKMMQ
jgi:N-acetylmuramoyl-L-alanine amidase